MPSVDVSSLITGLNPIRHSSSYTMPVLSPRHGSSTLTGSYRSTFSSSSIDRPYTNSYSTPRTYSYSERYTSRSYTSDDGKKAYARHASITDTDGVTSRFRDEGRDNSVKRDSISRDSGFRDGNSTRSNSLRDSYGRDSSLSRSETRNSRSDLNTMSVLESVADLRSRYSPANYVPAVLRKNDYGRSKSIGSDIGKPPIERSEPKAIKLKKVTNKNDICNGVALTNNTNKLDNNDLGDDNGNRTSVAEIRKKFDPNYCNRKETTTNGLFIEGIGLKPNDSRLKTQKINTENDINKTNGTNHDLKHDTEKRERSPKFPTNSEAETHINTKLFIGRPAKCSKTNDIVSQEVGITEESTEETILEENSTSKSETDNASSVPNISWTMPSESSSMEVSDNNGKTYNHTTNFASYIPNKESIGENEAMNEGDDSDMESSENNASDIFYQQRNANNDLSTSPRLNRATLGQNNVASSSGGQTINNLIPNSVQRSSPLSNRDDERSYDRNLSCSSNIKNQGLNGLKNIGNTCFMNSVLQCLSNTRYLLEYVKSDGFMDELNTTISGMKGSLIKAFGLVIQELWSQDSSDRVVNTLALKSQIQRFAPRFIGYSQQDAQEFLRYLLEGLHEDVNRITSKPTPIHTEIDEKLSDSQKAAEAWQRYLRADNSRVVDIFVGQLKSTLRCTHCGHCSVTFDPFWDLSLPIPQRQGPLRLQQCLEHFTREETLDGDEKPTCSKCKERRKCTKSFSIQKFPKILVIHLKRFSPTERFRGKLNVIIDFPLNGLDLSQYCAMSGHTECMYNLYAISNHSGTTYSGHYTAYCKHPYSQQWHEYNDSRVSTISPKNVISSEAYVLFYELVGQHHL